MMAAQDYAVNEPLEYMRAVAQRAVFFNESIHFQDGHCEGFLRVERMA